MTELGNIFKQYNILRRFMKVLKMKRAIHIITTVKMGKKQAVGVRVAPQTFKCTVANFK